MNPDLCADLHSVKIATKWKTDGVPAAYKYCHLSS